MNNNKGFTLAELLIVVAIIAVLTAIAVPIFTAQLDNNKEKVDTTASASKTKVEKKKEKIVIKNDVLEIKVGQEFALVVETESEKSVSNFKCKSSNTDVATVSDNCTVLGVSVGTTTITVTKDGQEASINLTVIAAEEEPDYYVPTPEPEPTPTPEPTPQPEPKKEPEPTPTPNPTPEPEPEPEEEPIEEPIEPEPEFVGFIES